MADDNTQSVKVDGRRVDVSNLDKVFFPESGITKGDLIDYYRRVAPVCLPHYRDRALTLQRFPDGIGEEGFFQKDAPDHFPDWVNRTRQKKQDGSVIYVIADKPATLVYLANQGCITPHLALARADKPDHPDRLIFDLDPSDDDFAKVQDAAEILKSILDELELPVYVQTTGSRGLHLVVPLDRNADFDTARDFARSVVEYTARRHPKVTTTEQRKEKRGNRVFLDYLRNAYGQTAVGPYAVRALKGAPVATPLRWTEATATRMTPRKYTIKNVFRRLARIDDPWSDMARHGCSIDTASRKLSEIA